MHIMTHREKKIPETNNKNEETMPTPPHSHQLTTTPKHASQYTTSESDKFDVFFEMFLFTLNFCAFFASFKYFVHSG